MKAILVAEISGEKGFKTRHYRGLPPELAELPEFEGSQHGVIDMPRAEIIAIHPDASCFFLIRYLRNGDFAGDTWHKTVEDAKHQAEYEFGTSEGDWVAVPEDQDDPVKFFLSPPIPLLKG
jgi:hypothetical protein